METFIDQLLVLLGSIYRHEFGSTEFYIFFGATFGGAVFIGRVLLTVFKSQRGVIAVFILFALSLALGLSGYVAVEEYGLDYLKADWAEQYLPWSMTAIVAIILICFMGPKLFELGPFISLIIALVSLSASVGLYFGTQTVLEIFDFGSEQVEKNEERKLQTIE
ncbi:MAG: hypothetical protein AAGH40_06750 [Verrucomicrobiota bacterium]